MICETLKNIILSTNLSEKYKLLSLQHNHDKEDRMIKVDSDTVNSIISGFGYYSKYYKKESFFKVILSEEEYVIGYNISLKYGLVEFIMFCSKDEKNIGGGPISLLISETTGDTEPIKKPGFCSYEELEVILDFMFNIVVESEIK